MVELIYIIFSGIYRIVSNAPLSIHLFYCILCCYSLQALSILGHFMVLIFSGMFILSFIISVPYYLLFLLFKFYFNLFSKLLAGHSALYFQPLFFPNIPIRTIKFPTVMILAAQMHCVNRAYFLWFQFF